MKSIVILTLIWTMAVASASGHEQTCTGTSSVGGAMVYGTCTDGNFSGSDSVSGETIYGTCSDNAFTGTESPSGALVSGSCTDVSG